MAGMNPISKDNPNPTGGAMNVPSKGLIPVIGNSWYRHFMNFTGVQCGELPATKSFTGDFAILWTGQWPQGSSGGYFFGSSGTDSQNDRLVVGNSPHRLTGCGFNETALPGDDTQIHEFKLSRISGVSRFYVDGSEIASVSYSGTFKINYIGRKYGGTTGVQNFTGIFERIQAFENGDENTGTPVPGLGDIRIDDPTSIYQRDYSQLAGTQLVSNGYFDSGVDGWASSSEYGATPSHFNSSMKVTSNGNYGRVVTAIETVPGRDYTVSVDILSLTARSLINITNFADGRGGGDEIVLITPNATGNYQLRFTATNTTTYIALGSSVAGSGDVYVFDNVEVKEFHGIELKNTVIPGDFDQYERRAGWNYWQSLDDPATQLIYADGADS